MAAASGPDAVVDGLGFRSLGRVPPESNCRCRGRSRRIPASPRQQVQVVTRRGRARARRYRLTSSLSQRHHRAALAITRSSAASSPARPPARGDPARACPRPRPLAPRTNWPTCSRRSPARRGKSAAVPPRPGAAPAGAAGESPRPAEALPGSAGHWRRAARWDRLVRGHLDRHSPCRRGLAPVAGERARRRRARSASRKRRSRSSGWNARADCSWYGPAAGFIRAARIAPSERARTSSGAQTATEGASSPS